MDSEPPPPSSAPHPTASQLSDLQSLLDVSSDTSKSLSGRKVMVPMTTKAFFPGTLQPTQTIVSGTLSEGSNTVGAEVDEIRKEEEVVLMNLGAGYLTEMSRSDASAMIGRRIESIVSRHSETEQKSSMSHREAKKKRPPKAKIGPSPVSMTGPDSYPSQEEKQREMDAREMDAQPLPYFEIREEYDAHGKEVKSEAINVAEELKSLRQNMKEGAKKGEGRRKEAADDLDGLLKSLNVDEGMEVDEEESDSARESNVPTHAAVSDEKYAAISTRLDELERLEEESDRRKVENKKSSQKLQSKGWAKGFLTSDPKKIKKAKKTKQAGTTRSDNADGDIGLSTSVASNAGLVVDSKEEKEPRKTTVAFRDVNEVREIPRVGQMSVKKAANQKSTPKPFERDAFTGVITERLVSERQEKPVGSESKKKSRFAQQRQDQSGQTLVAGSATQRKPSRFVQQREQEGDHQSSGSGSATSEPHQPRKRVSRFAQQQQHER